MSVVYPPGTARYAVASLLAAYGAMLFQAITTKMAAAGHSYSKAEVRAALIGMRRADLAAFDTSCERWSLTLSARKHWRTQHAALRTPAPQPSVDQPAPQSAGRLVIEPHVRMSELTSGIVRLSSPADRLPMVHRPGSLDAANLPSIEGQWRVWRDGRRELRDAA